MKKTTGLDLLGVCHGGTITKATTIDLLPILGLAPLPLQMGLAIRRVKSDRRVGAKARGTLP